MNKDFGLRNWINSVAEGTLIGIYTSFLPEGMSPLTGSVMPIVVGNELSFSMLALDIATPSVGAAVSGAVFAAVSVDISSVASGCSAVSLLPQPHVAKPRPITATIGSHFLCEYFIIPPCLVINAICVNQIEP